MIHSHTLSNKKENYSKKKIIYIYNITKHQRTRYIYIYIYIITKYQRTRRYCNVVLLMNAILKAWEEQDQPEELQWW